MNLFPYVLALSCVIEASLSAAFILNLMQFENRPNLSKVMLFQTIGSILSDFPFLSVVSHPP